MTLISDRLGYTVPELLPTRRLKSDDLPFMDMLDAACLKRQRDAYAKHHSRVASSLRSIAGSRGG